MLWLQRASRMGKAHARQPTNLAMWGCFRHNQQVLPAPSTPAPKTTQTWTILEVVRWTTGRFERQGIETARLDAELLATRAFVRSRVELYTHFDQPLAETELSTYRALVQRRLSGEPVAYILGRKEFWSIDLVVDERVLIPRPDTEALVEQGLEFLAHRESEPARVADIGTGSGAVAIALKKERPHDQVFAVDVSADALAVARDNAARLGLEIELLQGDLTAPLAGQLDLIVSNPPYIPSRDIDGLSPEVRNEPRLALDGGADGLALVRRLSAEARNVLAPGGWLAMEIGADQADAARAILLAEGYRAVGSRRDLGGIDRVVFGQREPVDERSAT
jgi:release factor glutamine methyltransferase